MNSRSSAGRYIFVSAGEASGDWAGSLLVKALRRQGWDQEVRGVGGKHMREAGVKIFADSSTWGVIGLFAVLPKLPAAYSTRFRAKFAWRKDPPAALVVIDCGPFNMPIARIARGYGVPVIYYLPPGSWSRRPRGKQLTKVANVIAAPFPWTKELLSGGAARVEWVGHPAAESVRPTMTREEAYQHYGLDPKRPIFALAPGSRAQELRSLLPVLAQAGLLLAREFPGAQFVIPVASSAKADFVRAGLREAGLEATLLAGMEYNALQLAQAAAVCSGTATLEFACLRIPMIVVYRPTALVEFQFRIRSARSKLKSVGLPNIIAGREVVQELLSKDATPEAIAAALGRFVTDEAAREAIQRDLEEVAAALGGPGASDRAAALVLETIAGG